MTQLRAVIYARYSSDLQREASIEDQNEVCRALAARMGVEIVESFFDAAITGSTEQRPGLKAMLAFVKSGNSVIVLAEALDRLSRDQEHIARIFKELSFAGAKIHTVAEGEISELHVGLKGTMNALFLKDLAAKTHRGLSGRIKNGRAASGISYGYKVKREYDHRGEPIRGGREIVEAEAEVVRRIFREFADGKSPRAIAKNLNERNITGPGGRPWQDTTIRGHAGRGTGILRNELYQGRLIWNRQRFVKDPTTGKRLSRPNQPKDWLIENVPQLKIVDEALWKKVASRLGDIAQSPTALALRKAAFWKERRPRYILTGLVTCGCCGHPLVAAGKDYLRCARFDRNGLCSNRRGIRRGVLESTVLSALQHNLMAPELVVEFISAFNQEVNRGRANAELDRQSARRRLCEVQGKLDGLITAIAEGIRSPGLQQRLDSLEAEKRKLDIQLSLPKPTPVRIHPNLAELYKKKIEKLHEALLSADTRASALELLRSIVEKIVVHPRGNGVFEIELIGEIANMVEIAIENERGAGNKRTALSEAERRSVKVVAGAGFEPTTFRL